MPRETSTIAVRSIDFSAKSRLLLACIAIVLLSLFTLAAGLTPEPSGIGTHEQLGLPECGVIRMWGVRCPTCGMTTAWAHVAQGEFRQGLSASMAGSMLAVLALPTAVWLLASATLGRWCYLLPWANLVFPLLATLVGLALFEWMVRVLPSLAG